MDNHRQLTELKSLIASTWQEIIAGSSAAQSIREARVDRRFYLLYLMETYHYAFHNSRNQALAGARVDNRDVHYMRYCFRHAYEEVGHELMALHDLRAMGLQLPLEEFPAPLAATQELIDYLYRISTRGNPLQRLGYSAWAEDSYEYFGPFLQQLQVQLGLEKKHLSFFLEHAGADDQHAAQVARTISRAARTEQDWEDVRTAARTSLLLTADMLESIFEEYTRLRDGQSSRFAFLNDIPLQGQGALG